MSKAYSILVGNAEEMRPVTRRRAHGRKDIIKIDLKGIRGLIKNIREKMFF
jgi:hypothetical protein